MSSHDHHDSHGHDSHGEEHTHVPSYGQPVLIFFILMALTGLSVALASLHLSATANGLVLSTLACIKAYLVVTYWMHLRYEHKVFWVLGVVAIITLIIVYGFTFFDYLFRSTLFQ
jgi:cytochrome c oxidase subunit 4